MSKNELTEAIIALLKESGLEFVLQSQALNEARAVINAPYFDPTMNGAKAGKTLLKPKESKKAKD